MVEPDTLRSIDLFGLAVESDLDSLGRLLEPVELRASEVLFRECEPGDAMWVLDAPSEVVVSSSQGGRRSSVVVMYAQKGEVLGELALVDRGPRSGTALVTVGGPAYRLDGRAFEALRLTFAPLAFRVLRKLCTQLSHKLRRTNARIVAAGASHQKAPELGPGPHPEPAVLEGFPAFRRLPSVVKLALAQKLELIEVPGVTAIFAEQEPSDGAWFLLEGEVLVGRNGKTLAHLKPGTMFGQMACLDHAPRSASCVTAGPATLLRMSTRDFDQLFASGHRFAFQLVDLVARQLAAHVREANHLLPLPGRPPLVAPVPSTPVLSLLDQKASHREAGRSTAPRVDPAIIELEVEVAALNLELELTPDEVASALDQLGA